MQVQGLETCLLHPWHMHTSPLDCQLSLPSPPPAGPAPRHRSSPAQEAVGTTWVAAITSNAFLDEDDAAGSGIEFVVLDRWGGFPGLQRAGRIAWRRRACASPLQLSSAASLPPQTHSLHPPATQGQRCAEPAHQHRQPALAEGGQGGAGWAGEGLGTQGQRPAARGGAHARRGPGHQVQALKWRQDAAAGLHQQPETHQVGGSAPHWSSAAPSAVGA